MKQKDWFIVGLIVLALLWLPKGSATHVLMYQDPDTGEWKPVPAE
jgi:hypothetical protein